MSLLDSIYDEVWGLIDEGIDDSDELYHTLQSCFEKHIVYSWSLYDIEKIIKDISGKSEKPTYESKRKVLRNIAARYPSRKCPARMSDILNLISDLLDNGEITFVNQNKIKIKDNKLITKIRIPDIVNIIEMQGELFDIFEKYGIKTKINKDAKPGKTIFYIEAEGNLNGLIKIKGVLEKQLKFGAKILSLETEEKDESKKQEASIAF